MADEKPSRAARPALRPGSMASGSYIQDHNNYARTTASQSLDQALQEYTSHDPALTLQPKPALAQPDSSPARSPPRIKDSGIIHNLTHSHCVPLPDDAPKLVATIFYNTSKPRETNIHADTLTDPHASPNLQNSPLPAPTIPDTAAPTTNLSLYPLEPPPPDPEPLHHLYGEYITEVCLTHFLHTLHSLQHPYQRITSSHRCLDSQIRPRVVEVTFSPPPNEAYLTFADLCKHELLWRYEREWNVEVVLQRDSVYRRLPPRLAVFDMDSTLVEQEVIDELAAAAGVKPQVATITARAMAGELDFAASLRARVALLRGIPASIWTTVQPTLTITPGARELLTALRRLGTRTAVLSGGFVPLARWLAAELGIDHMHANELAVSADGAALTGALAPGARIVDGARKRELLLELAVAEGGVRREQIWAVGDGANDLPMLGAAGLGVAFNAKPKVQLEAQCRLNGESLLDLLYLMGLTKDEIDVLVE